MMPNELKWRLESHEQYGWTNDAKMNSNEDLNLMSNLDGQMIAKMNWNEDLNPMSTIDGQMMPKWTQMNSNEDLNLMSNMDRQMMPKWTQMKTWIPWAIWMDKWCQNKLKWRLESHEQCGWINDAKWTQMKTWISWAIWMEKWCQNELKWRLEYHEQYGWTNDAKMNSNEDWNPMSNMDGQMMPKWTQMKTWIPWAIWMDKWCQNELKLKSRIPWAIWMDKWCQNELKWRLESHEQYGWTNDAKMNSNEDSNTMSNLDGQMMPKWTQMKTWIPWALLKDKWCQSELKWTQMKTWISWAIWLTNDAKMNSNEDLNPMTTIDGQMMPKWTQMNSNEDLNIMSNMDWQMMPKWT